VAIEAMSRQPESENINIVVHVDNAEESYKTMKKLAAVGAIGLLAYSLFAQGLNTGGQTKEDWEEINFEFNSSILSDGYPSLLRLADLLSQHRDYRVKVTGNTDYVGSTAYNEKLALKRADAVKAFLVKYGVADNQITTAGDGKRVPEVDNKTKEGRFMNRRVFLALTDGGGRLIKDGGIGDIIKAIGDKLYQLEDRTASHGALNVLGALDVRILHEGLLGKALGIGEEAVRDEKHLRYIRGIDLAVEEVRKGAAQIAFLLKPTSVRQVADTSFSGGVMPQKSTYFYPKLLSGMVMYKLD